MSASCVLVVVVVAAVTISSWSVGVAAASSSSSSSASPVWGYLNYTGCIATGWASSIGSRDRGLAPVLLIPAECNWDSRSLKGQLVVSTRDGRVVAFQSIGDSVNSPTFALGSSYRSGFVVSRSTGYAIAVFDHDFNDYYSSDTNITTITAPAPWNDQQLAAVPLVSPWIWGVGSELRPDQYASTRTISGGEDGRTIIARKYGDLNTIFGVEVTHTLNQVWSKTLSLPSGQSDFVGVHRMPTRGVGGRAGTHSTAYSLGQPDECGSVIILHVPEKTGLYPVTITLMDTETGDYKTSSIADLTLPWPVGSSSGPQRSSYATIRSGVPQLLIMSYVNQVGTLYCVDANNGTIVWKTTFRGTSDRCYVVGVYRGASNGTGTDGAIVVFCGDLYAIDHLTAKFLWQYKTVGSGGFSGFQNAVVNENTGRFVFICDFNCLPPNRNGLVVLNVRTGAFQAFYQLTMGQYEDVRYSMKATLVALPAPSGATGSNGNIVYVCYSADTYKATERLRCLAINDLAV